MSATTPNGHHVGHAMRRKEDPRIISGRARYIDDIAVPGMLRAAIVRSPEAHEKITSMDTSAAREHPEVVGVDLETGKVQVVRYFAVDDCGPQMNRMLVDGQIPGGVAHAIGQALYEQVRYDENGQLVTGTFVE